MDFKLPLEMVSQADVARALRELNALNDFFIQSKIREPGSHMQLPKTSKLIEQIAAGNQLNMLEESNRVKLASNLDQILGKAPTIHVSFASEPTPRVVEKILVWFRSNIHPQALLQVGLQPNIAAGCVVRTHNKVFDMSLKEHLSQQQKYLIQLIDAAAKRQ
jgi:F0F1-type ATP synthase delta subunit